MSKVIRLCLDLNIWCASLLADFKGRNETACQILVETIRQRECSLGKVKLIVSWGMMNRLQKVLEQDLQVSSFTAKNYLNIICKYADYVPQLTLGGSGVIAMEDIEDSHVLETCLASQADILVTANFKDFINKDTKIIIEQRYAIYTSANHRLIIVHPFLMVEWLKSGQIPN
ncbi:PIN domain-containing protein [Geminocystis herdmanii]|uniref:PIN domain-containing protein n=1 Tax=Geminocystis herdmanii TaxID=669359 RepID=UPI00034DDA0D|nr:PIN domain-containing protein [Geminocystis herdmanii]